MNRILLFSLLFTILACCGDDATEDGDAKADAKDDASNDGASRSTGWEINLPPELDSFDMEAIRTAWQGDRVVRSQNRHEAWHVEGDKLTTFHDGEEGEYTLDFFNPCKVGATQISERGVFSNHVSFSVLEGEILQNPGPSNPPAIPQGIQIVACEGSDFVYFDGSSCTYFAKNKLETDTISYEGQSAECEIKPKGEWGNFLYFKTESMSKPGQSKLYASIAEIPEDLRAKVVRKKYASFDEAKAALK
jgi:hypothetical protein